MRGLKGFLIRIYSVGVWNIEKQILQWPKIKLEFTPLEFETGKGVIKGIFEIRLEFTPLEFETQWLKKRFE